MCYNLLSISTRLHRSPLFYIVMKGFSEVVRMDRSHVPIFFGEWVKQRRKALDLTQEELAFRSGCSKFAVRKIESGERRPSRQLAGLMANALEISGEDQQNFIRAARGELRLDRLNIPQLNQRRDPDSHPPINSNSRQIPLLPKPLIGRESELVAMEKLINDPGCRLLTLTGMGGIGKTSLAIEFAALHHESFPAGVFYIPLASIKSLDAVVPAIAEILGYAFSGPSNPKDQLINYIAWEFNLPLLMVLDNLEHLLVEPYTSHSPSISDLIAEFLQFLPNLNILATSRESINLQGEWKFELHGLAIPPQEFSGNINDYCAPALFLQCALRIKADFEVTPVEENAIVQICRLVDGVPLAIELAAAWVGILSCQDIYHEIHSNFDFLTATMRDLPERHRSLRATIDHSWKLLSNEERDVVGRLSVFHGKFDRIAAEKVAAATLPLLASLVSKSLVRCKENKIFDMHEAIRQYAFSHLAENPKTFRKVGDLHSNYFLDQVARHEKSLRSSGQLESISELSAAFDNIRAAWIWAISQGNYDSLKPAVRSLGWFFELAGLYSEGIEQFELLIHTLRSESPSEQYTKLLGLAIMQKGLLYFRRGQVFPVQEIYEESLIVLRPTGDKALLMEALIFLGIIEHLNGDYQRSITLLEEGLHFAQECGDIWFMAYAIYNLGYIDSMLGEYLRGYEQMMTGLDMWRSIGDLHYIALGLNFMVSTLIQLGRYEEARTSMLESITLCDQAKNRWGMGTAYRFLGLAEMADGQIREAKEHFIKSIDIFNTSAEEWHVAQSQIYLGEAEIAAGNFSEAKDHFLKTLRTSIKINSIPLAMESILGLASLEYENGKPEHALELSSIVTRHPSISQEVRNRAKIMENKSQQLLPESKFQEIYASASTWTMEEFVQRYKVDDLIIHPTDSGETGENESDSKRQPKKMSP